MLKVIFQKIVIKVLKWNKKPVANVSKIGIINLVTTDF